MFSDGRIFAGVTAMPRPLETFHLMMLSPLIPRILLMALSLSLCAASAWAATDAKKIRVVLIGDSTVTDHAGWGTGFKARLTDDAECINTAQGGRSSKSFIDEGRLAKALELKGDYYLIQFGHNDQPGKGPERETDPTTTYPHYLTQYIDSIRAIGGKPILVTSLVRRTFDPENPHRILDTLGPWAAAVRKLGAEKKVPVIDLHASSLAYCERLGAKATAVFDVVKDGKPDTTHLDAHGAAVFGGLVADEVREKVPELAPYLRTDTPTSAAKAAPRADAIVSADNSGTHLTVGAAVAAAPANSDKPFIILVKPGRYEEHVHIPKNKPNIVLRGEPGEEAATVIVYHTHLRSVDANGRKLSTRDSATVLVQGANFTAENITFENTTTREERVQALAIYVDADRAVFRRCRFIGWQDTVRAENGRQYYEDCTISGHVDFIYGNATAVFSRNEIHCRADGYITAASTPAESAWGFVFLDCRVTAAPEVNRGVYLGRPWRPYSATAFVRTVLPEQIRAEGWHNWGKVENEQTARYREYRNTGPGAAQQKRVNWARELTADEARACTVENVLAGADGWNPLTLSQ